MSRGNLLKRYINAQIYFCDKLGHDNGIELTTSLKRKIVGAKPLSSVEEKKLRELLNALKRAYKNCSER